ncbi:NAD(P)-dependent oxidoreductase [Pelagibacterales bacterium]|nr:NAD(P)-dependent oxidoreductase [Pelagibacterales bacterium]
MKTLVIGGSGFLGSHIADQLNHQGHDVVIFDQIKSKWVSDKHAFIEGDIANFDSLSEAFNQIDAVFHLAAVSDLDKAHNDGLQTAKINVLGTVNALELSRVNKVSKFIYSSSIYVNSNSGGLYKVSKKAAEEYVIEYGKLFNLDYTIMRYGSIYGPRSDMSNGLYRIIKKAIKENKIEYEGSLDSIREYIHVEDVALASINALSNSSFKNNIINITGQERYVIRDLLKMIGEILNLDVSINEIKDKKLGHYVMTPYSYTKIIPKKYVMPFYIDFGQGLLQIIEEIDTDK